MKKNNKGFFLAETIVVLSLVTTIVVFVSANVPNLYKNYKLQIESYDRTEDIYLLKAIYEANESTIKAATSAGCDSGSTSAEGQKKYAESGSIPSDDTTTYATKLSLNNIPSDYSSSSSFYLTGYLSNISDSNDYDFNKYLKRMRKTSNFKSDYRLIGKLVNNNKTTYASIRIDNPNPNRACNLGEES